MLVTKENKYRCGVFVLRDRHFSGDIFLVFLFVFLLFCFFIEIGQKNAVGIAQCTVETSSSQKVAVPVKLNKLLRSEKKVCSHKDNLSLKYHKNVKEPPKHGDELLV